MTDDEEVQMQLLAQEAREWQAEAERLREYAQMYRYLRSRKWEIRWDSPDGESNRVRAWLSGDRLDAAIKEAMRGEK